jgi:hypothetical protein
VEAQRQECGGSDSTAPDCEITGLGFDSIISHNDGNPSCFIHKIGPKLDLITIAYQKHSVRNVIGTVYGMVYVRSMVCPIVHI